LACLFVKKTARLVRFGGLAIACLMMCSGTAAAEWQVQPFVGLTFHGTTSFVDLENAAGDPNIAYGVRGVLLGEVFGIDADIGYAPGFFQSGKQPSVLTSSSSVTTVTGNVVIALPRRIAQYSLRPYFVGGGGLIRARSEDAFHALTISSNLAAIDVGGGVTGFLTNRVGVDWQVRRFSSLRGKTQFNGTTFAPAQLSFWRASMALALRY
jgi:hypothetical protein